MGDTLRHGIGVTLRTTGSPMQSLPLARRDAPREVAEGKVYETLVNATWVALAFQKEGQHASDWFDQLQLGWT